MLTKLNGFSKLVLELEEATYSLNALEGEVTRLSIEPGDVAGARIMMRQIEAAIVRQTAAYCGNPLVGDLAKELRKTLSNAGGIEIASNSAVVHTPLPISISTRTMSPR